MEDLHVLALEDDGGARSSYGGDGDEGTKARRNGRTSGGCIGAILGVKGA